MLKQDVDQMLKMSRMTVSMDSAMAETDAQQGYYSSKYRRKTLVYKQESMLQTISYCLDDIHKFLKPTGTV